MTVTEKGPPAVVTERPARSAWDAMDRPFDQLKVGQPYLSRTRTITESDVVSFAALTGDWHPQHTDAEFSARSRFGQRVAHGLLLVGVAVGLVPNDYVIALRSLQNVVFKTPVVFGDTIQIQGVIYSAVPVSEEAGLVVARWRVVNQRQETVFKMDVHALWKRSWS